MKTKGVISLAVLALLVASCSTDKVQSRTDGSKVRSATASPTETAAMVLQYDGELEGLLRQFGMWDKEFMAKKGLIKHDPFALLAVKPLRINGPITPAQKQQYLESERQLEEKLRQAGYLDKPFKTQMEGSRTRSEIITDLKGTIEQWPTSG